MVRVEKDEKADVSNGTLSCFLTFSRACIQISDAHWHVRTSWSLLVRLTVCLQIFFGCIHVEKYDQFLLIPSVARVQ